MAVEDEIELWYWRYDETAHLAYPNPLYYFDEWCILANKDNAFRISLAKTPLFNTEESHFSTPINLAKVDQALESHIWCLEYYQSPYTEWELHWEQVEREEYESDLVERASKRPRYN